MPNIREYRFMHAGTWYIIDQRSLRRIRWLYRYSPSNAMIISAARTLKYEFKQVGLTIHLKMPKDEMYNEC